MGRGRKEFKKKVFGIFQIYKYKYVKIKQLSKQNVANNGEFYKSNNPELTVKSKAGKKTENVIKQSSKIVRHVEDKINLKGRGKGQQRPKNYERKKNGQS